MKIGKTHIYFKTTVNARERALTSVSDQHPSGLPARPPARAADGGTAPRRHQFLGIVWGDKVPKAPVAAPAAPPLPGSTVDMKSVVECTRPGRSASLQALLGLEGLAMQRIFGRADVQLQLIESLPREDPPDGADIAKGQVSFRNFFGDGFMVLARNLKDRALAPKLFASDVLRHQAAVAGQTSPPKVILVHADRSPSGLEFLKRHKLDGVSMLDAKDGQPDHHPLSAQQLQDYLQHTVNGRLASRIWGRQQAASRGVLIRKQISSTEVQASVALWPTARTSRQSMSI